MGILNRVHITAILDHGSSYIIIPKISKNLIMLSISIPGLKIKLLKRKWSFFLLLSIMVSILCVFITSFHPQKLHAQEPSKQSALIAHRWQYASFPVDNFQRYTSGFGYRIHPVTGRRSFHNGLDIAAPLGSYVHNWWGGTVVSLSDHTSCGTSIQIRSGNWTHLYCHLMGTVESSNGRSYLIDRHGGIQLWQGAEIASGEIIGRIGLTGRTTGPHLHWTLKHNGKYIDPALVLQEMFAQQN